MKVQIAEGVARLLYGSQEDSYIVDYSAVLDWLASRAPIEIW